MSADFKMLLKRLDNPPFGTETSERLLMEEAAAALRRLIAERDEWARWTRIQQEAAYKHYARAEKAEAELRDAHHVG